MYAYRSLVRIGTDIYDVKRIFFQSAVKDVNAVKEWLQCTHAFHRDGLLYFCQIIENLRSGKILHRAPEVPNFLEDSYLDYIQAGETNLIFFSSCSLGL
jgi:hypothetical protein